MQYSFASTPLVIEITEGIESIPVEPGDVDQQTSSSFVKNIDAEEIRDTHIDLSQVIENNSGIKIRQIGGLGSQSLVSIRGKSSDQVMIYLDGMLLNNASGGSVDLSHISAGQIARIEIYKDIVPVEFSQVSNGGVINIITHRTSRLQSTDVGVSLGSFDTQKADFSLVNNVKSWQFVLSGSYIESENDFPFVYENGTFQNSQDDEVQNRHNNQLYQHNILAKAKYRIDSNRSIQYQGELLGKKKHLPSISNSEINDSYLSFENQYFHMAYSDESFFNDDIKFNVVAKAGSKDTVYDDSQRNIGLEERLVEQHVELLESKFLFKLAKQSYQLISNTEVRKESLRLEDYFDKESARSNTRLTLSSALQLNYYFKNKKIIVSPAARYFYSTDSFSGETLTESGFSNQLEKTFNTFSPQLGIRYDYAPDFALKFNVGQYYRLPNYIELFGSRGYIGSNETLKPEKGINLDAGFEYMKNTRSEKLTRVNWAFSAFYSQIEDEIVYSFNARGEGKPSNNRRSIISGIENNLKLELFYEIEVVSNTTLLFPFNESDPNDIKLLAGRSLWSQSTRFVLNRAKWETLLEHVWESSYFYDSEQRLESKEKSTFNAGFNYKYKKTRLSLELRNILDHKNKDYYFQVAPGRSLVFSINHKFN